MSLLFSNEIIKAVEDELKNATKSVQIITAYCKEAAFDHLNSLINQNIVDKRMLVRFRLGDILKGSTDFSVLENAISDGWAVYIHFDLHAKTYVVDDKRAVVGSANTTRSGLNMCGHGNVEMATLVGVEQDDLVKLNKLFEDAIVVDNELINKLSSQLQLIPKDEKSKTLCWDSSITSMFNPHIDVLFSHEFPDTSEVIPGSYYAFLDETFSGDYAEFKESFRWCNAYMWLISVLEKHGGCLYFGELTEKLHNALITDPKPYRKDVKVLLANLLSIIDKLEMDEVVIDRPNHSQRVRLQKMVQ